MMKKEYQAPFINVVKFETENVLVFSADQNYGGSTGGSGDNTGFRPFSE
ncbi:MAG: hypothetical protein IJC84_06925 [Clostridia bacterium]|nr:hypothetical protein [Clostridia bacterium]